MFLTNTCRGVSPLTDEDPVYLSAKRDFHRPQLFWQYLGLHTKPNALPRSGEVCRNHGWLTTNENGEWLCGLWWIKLSMAIGDMKNTWAKGESIITVGSNTTSPYHGRPIKIGHVLTSLFSIALKWAICPSIYSTYGHWSKIHYSNLVMKNVIRVGRVRCHLAQRVAWVRWVLFFFWEAGGCCWYAYSTSSYLIHIQPFNKVQTMILKNNTVKESKKKLVTSFMIWLGLNQWSSQWCHK